MTQYNSEYVPTWLARSLQSFVFWAAYKAVSQKTRRIREVTLQDQLTEIMGQCCPPNCRASKEPKYRVISPRDLAPSRWEADVAVRLRWRHDSKGWRTRTRFLFELKIADANRSSIDHDLHKLATLSRAKRARGLKCQTFLLVLSQGEPPARFANMGKVMTMESRAAPDLCFTYETLGIFTATAIGREHNARYLCLVEVTA